MYLDFIKTPFNNNPSMQKYSGSLINETPRSSYLEQKINQVSLYGSELYGETELFQRLNLLEKVEEKLKINKNNSLKDLSFQIEEDIAVMHKGKLEAISLVFPSGWIPSKALGRDFSFLHKPSLLYKLLLQLLQLLSVYQQQHQKHLVHSYLLLVCIFCNSVKPSLKLNRHLVQNHHRSLSNIFQSHLWMP